MIQEHHECKGISGDVLRKPGTALMVVALNASLNVILQKEYQECKYAAITTKDKCFKIDIKKIKTNLCITIKLN